jgi:hypothetical protein
LINIHAAAVPLIMPNLARAFFFFFLMLLIIMAVFIQVAAAGLLLSCSFSDFSLKQQLRRRTPWPQTIQGGIGF